LNTIKSEIKDIKKEMEMRVEMEHHLLRIKEGMNQDNRAEEYRDASRSSIPSTE